MRVSLGTIYGNVYQFHWVQYMVQYIRFAILFFFQNLDYMSLFFSSLWALDGKYAINLTGHLFHGHFWIFSSCFTFENLTVICCGEELLWSCLFGSLCTSCTWMYISSSILGTCLIISLNKASRAFCSSFIQEQRRSVHWVV